ncbi:hypothetical protein DID77_03685 [Candidatus Marinamargulisbacteria bacterium SCGC AG-439-L15]|nr:hypothetical protein DID77_03685 [Candidatus Marinamargulisbacteria bacterium SCGC AG-439-L15]
MKNTLDITKEKLISTEKLFQWIFLFLCLILTIGIPLIFSTATRSVFEINKLTVMRLGSILIIGLWFFKSIFYNNTSEESSKNTITILGLKWQKIGLEIPLIIWSLSLIASTIFSESIRIGLFGSYDRWEGLFTAINYIAIFIIFAKIPKTKQQVTWIFWGIILASFLSGIYGIFQSMGFDMIRWSLDPTKRVFACINNPVHFCAYMGMVVPLGVGLTLYYCHHSYHKSWSEKKLDLVKMGVFIMTVIIYYNQYLSYSRATWLGFIGGMTLFYIYALLSSPNKSPKTYVYTFLTDSIFIALFYLYFIFHIHKFSSTIASILYVLLIISLGFIYRFSITSSTDINATKLSQKGLNLLLVGLSFFNIIYPFVYTVDFSLYHHGILSLGMLLCFFKLSETHRLFWGKLILIFIFSFVQYVALSWEHFFIYAFLCLGFYLLCVQKNPNSSTEKKQWLFSYLIVFALVIVLPIAIASGKNLFQKNTGQKGAFKILKNVNEKIGSYKNVALEGTARTSMWKSSVPWTKDYWLIGSGLDTIKFIYPKYRRPDYGILEGGHHFTPDRLHNEYLNTLATKGIFGFVAYYLVFILSWLLLLLYTLYKYKNHPATYLIFSLIAGSLVYFGQVLFNFGVVATLFLLYVEMGLAIAILTISKKETESEQDNAA